MWFIILLAIAVIPAAIAKSKGRSFLLWYIYGVALWIIALIHSIVLKEDTSQTTRESITGRSLKKCPFCSEFIDQTATVCRYCGKDLNPPKVIEEETRICPYCAETVKKAALICRYCGKDLRKYDEEQQSKIAAEEERKRNEFKERFKDIESLLKDENINNEAKERRRIYSKKMAVEYLKEKASEAGINSEEVTEDSIDNLLGFN